MKRSHSVLLWLIVAAGLILDCTGLLIIPSWIYTTSQLRLAARAGVYSSAEEGMLDHIARGYVEPDDTQIIYAGTNSFDGSKPHVWYVIACVWGGRRLDGSPTGSARHDYDQPGLFFLNTKEGWVFMPEAAFPGFLGFWMEVFGLAGPGSSVPTHDWGSTPERGCAF